MMFGLTLPFLIVAIITVAGAMGAAIMRNVVHCALSLTVTFAGLALLFLQLDAQFAGFAQVLVYVGAVAILVVFAILLTRGVGTALIYVFSKHWTQGLAIAAAVFALLGWAVLKSLPAGAEVAAAPQVTVKDIGAALMNQYVLPLEIVAVLLTLAMIGAVIVAMPEGHEPGKAAPGEEGGQ
jgi:NADH-quinone oxidoreductase subunit J